MWKSNIVVFPEEATKIFLRKSRIVVLLGDTTRIFMWKFNIGVLRGEVEMIIPRKSSIHGTIAKMFSMLINIQKFVHRRVICPLKNYK